ncbi:hypothetical protein DNH61_06800 [Paenibacillus sambharensis]|uniref:Glucodextranase-like C-terminal domain-containing protein n=1 Tax=Paenibacillus sambharensis TaxID=1803190 RepID=A0A2W1LXU1_9BACL|nr:hypothetical protein [Paenibacillus sambharensis]PZD96511.1 hypothetical protein DNH61_06800 [Paenibacillus sambharensis]
MRNKVLILMICTLLLAGSSSAVVSGEEAGSAAAPNLVTVDTIDLDIHKETTGQFTSLYTYENPFKGQDTSKGVTIEFMAVPTWEPAPLGTIFSIMGSGDYDGRLYFTPASYLGYNAANFGGYFDANIKDYLLVEDYIKEQASIKIEIVPTGFKVFANGELAYDQSILDDELRAAGDFKGTSDFTPVLNWIANADTLHFGYGSWWNNVNADEAYVQLSDIRFGLADGTVLLDKFVVDEALIQEAVESSESISMKSKVSLTIPAYTGELTSALAGTKAVDYEGFSVIPIVLIIVAVILILAILIIVRVTKPAIFKRHPVKLRKSGVE